VRVTFALVILIACIRLLLTEIWLGPPISQAQEQNAIDEATTADQPTLDAVERMMNAHPGSPHDPDRRFFNRLMVEVAHRDYEAAAAGFRLFVELHPTSSLSEQAEYSLGECEYQLGHYQEAIEAFNHTLSHPRLAPPLAAAAFLGKGKSYARLGDVQQSRSVLELIVVQFPTAEEAVEARQMLLLP
jgi:TolA-binding protein